MNCCVRFMILPHNQGKSCRYFISCVQKHLELMFSVKMIQYVTLNKPKPALQIKRGSFYPPRWIKGDKWNQNENYSSEIMCFMVISQTVGDSSWGPVRPTAASPPHSGCLVAVRWQRWSWRGWTPRLPVLGRLWSSPSGSHTHIRKKERSVIAWCVPFRCASVNKSSTPVCTAGMGWE